jgi:hypothetical protein
MSLTHDLPRAEDAPAGEAAPEQACAACGAAMVEDQEWCLQCGTRRTLIRRPPDWRIGAAVIATVVLLALVGFGIAMVNLSSTASTGASSAGGGSAAAAPTAIAGWPAGATGWTVVLAGRRTQAAADQEAQRLTAAGVPVGVLSTDQHPGLRPGFWDVYSGRYASEAQAAGAMERLRAQGQARARVKRIA